MRVPVRLTPRGGSDRVDGVRDGELAVRVAAPPVDGAANLALIRLVARELGVPASVIRIATGTNARRKTLALRVDARLVVARWPGLGL